MPTGVRVWSPVLRNGRHCLLLPTCNSNDKKQKSIFDWRSIEELAVFFGCLYELRKGQNEMLVDAGAPSESGTLLLIETLLDSEQWENRIEPQTCLNGTALGVSGKGCNAKMLFS